MKFNKFTVWAVAVLLCSLLAAWQTPAFASGFADAKSFSVGTNPRSEPTAVPPAGAAGARLAKSYGKLPLAFEANQGQTDSRVKFLSRGAGYTLFLTDDEAVLALRKANVAQGSSSSPAAFPRHLRSTARGHIANGVEKPQGQKADPALHRLARQLLGAGDQEQRTGALRMRLVGANPDAPVKGLDELPGKSNYFIGNDPKKWRTNVANYAKVAYENVYPGVDLVYYGNQGQLEYDFVVAPGADPRLITLDVAAGLSRQRKHGGVKPPLRIDRNGDLVLKIGSDEIRFHKPVAYQTDAQGGKEYVETRYVLGGKRSQIVGHQSPISFETGSYDRYRPLVIDPALTYATYLGGSGEDQGFGIAVDASGAVYVTGHTTSSDFPTTPGAFDSTCSQCGSGYPDAFVAKLNPTGAALVYSTYLGGTDNAVTYGEGIALDSVGSAYVTGYTDSSTFPTTQGAFQPAYAGGYDGFVTKLNSTGSALLYSTYLGGSDADQSYGIATDSSGDAYVTGFTQSLGFPTTPGAFQTACDNCTGNGNGDAFVTELNPAGSALAYSTYLGGSSTDYGYGIAVDASGDSYVTGYTLSADFPATPGAFQTVCPGSTCAFVTKLNPTGSALTYSTFLGGGEDQGYAIALDRPGDAYVTGRTGSSAFPTTSGAFQTAYGGNEDAFVTELNFTGSALVYSSYLGGNNYDQSDGIAVDGSENVYVIGFTNSTNFPTTVGAFQGYLGTGYDVFVTQVKFGGSALVYSTCLGSGNEGIGLAITVDPMADFYITGYSGAGFPTTPQAFQASCSGGCNGVDDAFVGKFVPGDQVWPLNLNFGTEPVGNASPPQTVTLTNSAQTPLNITSVSASTNNGSFAQTNTCSSSLAAGASCTISTSWMPSAAGSMSGTITITDDAANSPQTVSLAGTGVQPAITLSPTSLTFPTQVVFTSKTQTVTLTNSGSGALSITSMAVTGKFSQTNTCGTSVAAGASCTISVTFRPTTKGTQTGTVSITDNAPGSPQKVTLTGTGTYVQLSPTSLNFGSQPVGTKSLPKKITLTNKGTVTVSLTSIAITGTNAGDFAKTSTCGSNVAAGASCFITVTFTPKAKGNRSASVSVSDNGGGSPQKVSLSGLGT